MNKPDFVKDDETSVSGEVQSGGSKSDSQSMTESHKNAVDSLIDRVESLGPIPANSTDDIFKHIAQKWHPMSSDRDPEAEAASNEFINSLECFSDLKSRIVGNLPSYGEEVQERLQNLPNGVLLGICQMGRKH